MFNQEDLNYTRIARSIDYIRTHFKTQPDLAELAAHVHLSPFHFQRMFQEWAGISPAKFLRYTSLQYAKQLLRESPSSVFDVAVETGLSGTGRLHDLFVSMEGMTPGEFKQGAENRIIRFDFYPTPFGKISVASTTTGICYMAFEEDETKALQKLQTTFPSAVCIQQSTEMHQQACSIFHQDWKNRPALKLHLKGTPFQLKVWEALLKIPMGKLTTYGQIAAHINLPQAARAVGTAIGSNPVAFIIPCHRVIQKSGQKGGYMWGETRKTALIGWEAAQVESTFQQGELLL